MVINPIPSLSLSARAYTICAGNSLTITAFGASAFTWSLAASLSAASGSVVFASPFITATYSVNGNSLGCTSSTSVQIVVTPTTTPIAIVATFYSVCAGFTSTITAFGASTYTWTGTNITTPVIQQSLAVTAGTYTAFGTSAGCIYSGSISIGLSPNLTINVSRSSATTCVINNQPAFSKAVVLTASGAATYVWFPYTPISINYSVAVRPVSTTCCTVLGTTAICSGTAISCVTVIPQFSMSVSPSVLTMCLGDTRIIEVVNVGNSAVGPASAWTYNWTEALNAPPISLSSYFSYSVSAFPQNSTTYTVELWDARQCVSLPTTGSVTVNPCTGITKVDGQNLFLTYPNPVTSQLKLRSALSGNFDFCITDVLGKKFLQELVNMNATEETRIDLATLPPGVYFFNMSEFGKPVLVQKIIKE